MMGYREKLKNGLEYDAFSGWRRVIKWARGERMKIKKAFRRRIRRAWKQQNRGDSLVGKAGD